MYRYVVLEYVDVKEDYTASKNGWVTTGKSSINKIVDFSNDLSKFSGKVKSVPTFKALGHTTIKRKYRGKEHILFDVNAMNNPKFSDKIKSMIREHKIDVLHI